MSENDNIVIEDGAFVPNDDDFPDIVETEENKLIPVEQDEMIVIIPTSITELRNTQQKMIEYVNSLMYDGVDYGIIPGTGKKTLLKPGAEKLQRLFQFSVPLKLSHSTEEWTKPITETSYPLFHYRYTASVYNNSGKLVSNSDGECNSYEVKYRWRWVPASKVPRKYNLDLLESQSGAEREPAFAINKKETAGSYGKPADYWQSWEDDIASGKAIKVKMKKRDGGEMDAWERDGALYRIPNEDIFSQVNTLIKMAQKRAYIGAIIIASNASEFFTQDMEDFIKEDSSHNIKDLVPDKDSMARKLMQYVTSLGIQDAGIFIKKLLQDNDLTWSLDNWITIIDLINNSANS